MVADYQRFRFGGRDLMYAVDAAAVIDQGDLLFMDADDVKDAAAFTWDTSVTVTRQKFAPMFAGVAAEKHTALEAAGLLRVRRQGVFAFPCTSSAFEIGDLVGPDKASGNNLEAQDLVKVTDPSEAIGVVTKRYGSVTTTVEVYIHARPGGGSALDVKPQVKEVWFGPMAHLTAETIIDGYVFGKKVKIVEIMSLEITAITANSVITVKRGASSLDDTLTVTATGLGTFLTQAVDDANGYDYFDADDTMDIASDGTASAGTVSIGIRYIELE